MVPDKQLLRAYQIATDNRLQPISRDEYLLSYASDFTDVGFYFLLNNYNPHNYLSRRLILLPLSWAGFNLDELSLIPKTRSTPQSPCNVPTLSRAAACATFVRMVAREHRGSNLRHTLILDLAKVLTYGLFNMTYKGDYMELRPMTNPKRKQNGWGGRGRLIKSSGGAGEMMSAGLGMRWWR